ncbi:MFS transporter [Thalassotalea sp. HSM 43]|uniref:peptide MFS transporter n=1 Tax=Thalassotalea sp. HSM 43 TaxID=2552945 RepID=UPI00107FF52A|nr:peptide MFS transporter [Thalassotalea sp. HSM 43]QBY05460.1 MFS transporter [Thalassotalea sp. HSM 43]
MTQSTDTLLGHPKGLFLLFGTEMWERFSYYGMRAILVLYLIAAVETGGFGWTNSEALALYGWFTMAVYLTPVLGGWIADNVLGQRKSIILGGILMATGHFTLGTPQAWLGDASESAFYIGLILLCCGNGLFKPNISTLVGDLYQEGDSRRDGAFTIFYMGINIGAAIAPLVVGYVAEVINWQLGFIVAGFGMVISVIMQLVLANKYLGEIGVKPSAHGISTEGAAAAKDTPLTAEERDRVKVIVIMSVISIVFWVSYEQAGGLLNIYAKDFTDRHIFGWEMPASWLQSVSAIFVVMFAPVFAGLWTKLGDKQPSSPRKFAFSLLLVGIGFLFMVAATMQQDGDLNVKVSVLYLIVTYMFLVFGELCISPIGLSLVSKLAPIKYLSLLMGVWFACSAIANKVAGVVGGLIGEGPEQINNALSIFAGLAVSGFIAGGLVLLMADKLVEWMHGAEAPTQVEHSELDQDPI